MTEEQLMTQFLNTRELHARILIKRHAVLLGYKELAERMMTTIVYDPEREIITG